MFGELPSSLPMMRLIVFGSGSSSCTSTVRRMLALAWRWQSQMVLNAVADVLIDAGRSPTSTTRGQGVLKHPIFVVYTHPHRERIDFVLRHGLSLGGGRSYTAAQVGAYRVELVLMYKTPFVVSDRTWPVTALTYVASTPGVVVVTATAGLCRLRRLGYAQPS
jgi:hypothetical protein